MALLETTHHTQSQPSQKSYYKLFRISFKIFLKLCKCFLRSTIRFFNCFVILELLSLCEFNTSFSLLFQKSLMLLYSLLKTQHFAIPLSVTVSKAKSFSSPPFQE